MVGRDRSAVGEARPRWRRPQNFKRLLTSPPLACNGVLRGRGGEGRALRTAGDAAKGRRMSSLQAPLFQLLSARLGWLGQRQATLSQNIANADTPNYRPRDLRARDFERLVSAFEQPA